jgi:hypothetical protein
MEDTEMEDCTKEEQKMPGNLKHLTVEGVHVEVLETVESTNSQKIQVFRYKCEGWRRPSVARAISNHIKAKEGNYVCRTKEGYVPLADTDKALVDTQTKQKYGEEEMQEDQHRESLCTSKADQSS